MRYIDINKSTIRFTIIFKIQVPLSGGQIQSTVIFLSYECLLIKYDMWYIYYYRYGKSALKALLWLQSGHGVFASAVGAFEHLQSFFLD